MRQTRLFLLVILAIFCQHELINAQECSMTLTGTYQFHPQEEDASMYDAFVFNGAGKVNIQSISHAQADFFQVGDTVVIYPDKSVLIFLLKEENTLVGISTWVKDHVYKRMANDTITSPPADQIPQHASLFYEYYKLMNRDAPSLSTYMEIISDTALRDSLDRLCNEGLPKACITMANALMLDGTDLLSLLLAPEASKEQQKKAPNKEVLRYFTKAIELNELDAIAQLGAYLLLLGHKEQAIKVFEKGCELGHPGCCFSIAALDLGKEEE